ncbi:MAG: alpha/beta hydrolase fold domain-containing protein [Verrucomicrobiales bacterium]|nr:alpha/beta hydrolase fold domain-containing protein [Verrucomicrobiales bacterium]
MHSPARICPTLVLLILAGSIGGGPADAAAPAPRSFQYQMETNLPYRTGNDPTEGMRERCRLDVYHPVGTTNFATVVWFHGGGLTGGERAVPSGLQNQGIAVVAAGYRLSPQVHAPAYIEDAAAAVAWTFRHIGDFGGDTNRIFVSGHSAGGYLASMVGLDKRWLAAQGMDANAIAGLAPYSGQAITHFTIRAERGIPETRPVIDEYAPLYHARPDAPPLLILSGDRELELLGRYEENAYFARMMRLVGHTNTVLHEFGGYGHGAMAEPGHPLLLQFVRRVSAQR